MDELLEPHDVRALSRLLDRAQRALTAAEREALRPYGLTPAAFQLLDLVVARGEIAPGRAAEHLGVSRPTISGWIGVLTDARLVDRGGVDGDARRAIIVPTADGRRVWKGASEAIRRRQLRLVARALDANAQADLLAALTSIADELPGGRDDA
jgi:DNA-binding MarR family transcriptional regulator